MRRALLAIACVAGGTVFAASALVFYFGCCVLPFHRVLHRLIPLCALTKTSPSTHHVPVTPATKSLKAIAAPRVAVPYRFVFHDVSFAQLRRLPRSRMTHGAARCDEDVGLHTLLATYIL